ncbi:HNH endonuclease signature motif containing protein [Arthrobacter sp. 24S4-2]|uniref:HNH endonuclease signature motif containing protein n=1 Tax=Arthrobacter sp. 24S4-2 TaxID=2575374 RepID=UPI0020C7D164|nr:HNH endonuclease signature motif containing protein [Arthrobacter sp. 24S4-2]
MRPAIRRPAAGRDPAASGGPGSAPPDPADDGSRNAPGFLRARLRISAAEARRRITLASAVLPRTGFTGHTEPPERPELAAAVAAGTIGSRPATIITLALDRVRHHAPDEALARMEHALTRTAAERDTDFLTRIARQWTDAIDQDGSEPSEEELRRRQGAFLRPARRGLHHLEIFATPDQYESLLTVMNTATNPRTPAKTTEGNDADADTATTTTTTNGAAADTGVMADTGTGTDGGSVADGGGGTGGGAGDSCDETGGNSGALDADLDLRTLPQRLLDGLIGACKAALATGTLPAAGGLRPQVMVTIDYRDLLEHTTNQGPRYRSRTADTSSGYNSTGSPGSAGHPDNAGYDDATGNHAGPATSCAPGEGPRDAGDHTDHGFDGFGSATAGHHGPTGIPGTGSFTFTGPVTAATVRKIACDAGIIPVLLGSEGRILDIGRTTRIFPPHIRKVITARDQGCAFPGCTIPAPWCEAHHITYWSHGGPTSTDNGTLLCSHHHHLIHKELWTIQVKTGIPWFIPPPHIDPHQQPQRNRYFKT